MVERRPNRGSAPRGGRPSGAGRAQAPGRGSNGRAPRHSSSPSRRPSAAPTHARRASGGRQCAPRAYNAPSVWTKDAPRANASANPVVRALAAVGRLLLALLALAGKALGALAHAFAALVSRSRIALAITAALALVLVAGLVDLGLNANKAYPGVHVGDIDAGGKTADELAALIDETYGARLAGGSVVIYANEDAAARSADEASAVQDEALAEQLAVEEARASKEAWTADAATLEARVPAEQLAAEALAVGREDGGPLARIGALVAPRTLEPRADYGAGALEALASDIDAAIGDARVDYGVAVEQGTAYVTPGHDGFMVDREAFARELDRAFLGTEDGQGSFVAHADYAPLRVDEAAAQAACDNVNATIADGARFTYGDATWLASPSDLGAWVGTRVDGSALVAFVDPEKAKPALLAHVASVDRGDPIAVSFSVADGQVTVNTDGTGTIPLASEAADSLNEALFGENGKGSAAADAAAGEPVEIAIGSGSAPASLSFDEALDLGIVGSIGTYTTEFTTGAGTENRNHNIALVSELLTDSVVEPGGSWSFNETAGECNEERGFLGAGAIIDGEYDDAVGGGICQVATTMFNAVYESGFPVTARRNHSLYISSYPAGRDAAVSWPDLDFVWENDSANDVLVRLSCVDGSVTATLYGVDPGYRVSSETGEWSEGEHYATRTTVDETLAPGTSYVKTRGTDGRTITVIRTVADEAGNVLRQDAFGSVYDPVTEVVVEGPKPANDGKDEGNDDAATAG